MAMLPASNADIAITVQGYNKTSEYDTGTEINTYQKSATGVTLEKSKFYRNFVVNFINLSSTVVISAGETYTLNGANISVTDGPAIRCAGDATIILDGTNTVTTTAKGYPAIQAGGSGTTLTIQGSGSLTATGGEQGAGIGGGSHSNCGNIVIKSGTIEANGGNYGAGIGGSESGECGDIIINGGTVMATGGGGAAGIGGGWDGPCGNITINDGTITAIGEAAGIGGGSYHPCGDITINGGTVTATSINDGAGIGCNFMGTCGNITISGGTVTATGGAVAAGIGTGEHSTCGDITITSGVTSVEATMGIQAEAPIGKGKDSNGCGSISIDGTTSWTAGTATEHFNWAISTVKDNNNHDVTRWTLTKKP